MQTCGNLRIEGKRNLEIKQFNCAYLTFAWLVVHDSAIIFAPSWSLPQISSITRANARFAAVGHSTIQHAFFDCPGLPARPVPLPPSSRATAPWCASSAPSINDVTRRGGGWWCARVKGKLKRKAHFILPLSYDDDIISLDSLFAAIDCYDLEAETRRDRRCGG